VLPYEDSPNKEHQEAEMQESEKSFSNSFELDDGMDTDDYVSCSNSSTSFPSGNTLHSHLHECSKQFSVMNSDSSRNSHAYNGSCQDAEFDFDMKVKAKPHARLLLPILKQRSQSRLSHHCLMTEIFSLIPVASTGLTVYSHVVDTNMSFTAVNRTNKPANLAATRAGTLSDLDMVTAYQAYPAAAELSAVALEQDSASVHTTPNPSRATTMIDNGLYLWHQGSRR
jgi:hypothetical protein